MKKLKYTKFGKVFNKIKKPLGSFIGGLIEATPLSGLKSLIDTDNDGRVTVKDLGKIDWLKVSALLVAIGMLIKFDILNFEQIKEIIGWLFE